MFLPNRYQAYIPPPKLTAYLLSTTHAVGKSKARYFITQGFEVLKAALLEQALLKIAHNEPVVQTDDTPYGVKYVIDGSLETPSGNMVAVRTVWIIETSADRPRFVTAYPL